MTSFVISFSESIAPWHVSSRRRRAITFCALTASTAATVTSRSPQDHQASRFVFDGDNPVVWLDRGPGLERACEWRKRERPEGLDHWLKEVAATDVVLYERWMNNEIMVRSSGFWA